MYVCMYVVYVYEGSFMYVLLKNQLYVFPGVAIDGKFLKFTSRLSTSSALLLPLRTPAAPLVETEEEHSRRRAIAAQGKEFDKFEKYKIIDRKAELVISILMYCRSYCNNRMDLCMYVCICACMYAYMYV